MPDPTTEDEIRRQGRRIDAILDELLPADGLSPLVEPIRYHLGTGGKRVRPALCLATCDALGGDSEYAIPFAAAVELLHNMLLLHDDIEDGDEMRRDQPTVWKKYGVANGINAGDYLLGRAVRAVMLSQMDESVRLQLLELFLDTYERTIEGQALDINARSDTSFDVAAYMRMAQLKTGHYLVLGMVGGAIVAGASKLTRECLQELGMSMGPAFQIRDDLLDLTAGKGRGGVRGSDVFEGKASILYAHALAHSQPPDQDRLLDVMRKPREQTKPEDVSWVIDLYDKCGSLTYASDTANTLIATACNQLEKLPTDERVPLHNLVIYMVERTR